MLLFAGSRSLGAQNLTNTTLLSWLAYGYRCHPMPHQLEAFKIGRSFRLSENRLVVALIVASIVGTIISIVGHVALYYEYRFAHWGVGEFNRLQSWIIAPRAPNLPAIQHIMFGFLSTGVLTFLKRQFFVVAPFTPSDMLSGMVGLSVGCGSQSFWDGSSSSYSSQGVGFERIAKRYRCFGICIRSVPRGEPLEFDWCDIEYETCTRFSREIVPSGHNLCVLIQYPQMTNNISEVL